MPSDPPSPPDGSGERPSYRVYRARPKLLARTSAPPQAPRETPPPGAPAPPRASRRRVRWGRVLRWAVLAVLGWIALSVVLFLFSAQFLQDRVDDATKDELASPGLPVVSPATVLILGSDLRAKGSREPGAATSGPSRSDSMQLLRVGGGHSAKLSIPRDMVVEIPGYGLNKINAAYALGGSALAVKTVKSFLGIEIDHVILVNFERFPELIDAMGGITYTGGCVVSRINGGFRNGGYTLRLSAGSTRIDGDQALALARTRTNLCNRRETELTRERRQQKIISAMRSRALSPMGFVRWPLIAWRAPQTITSDMGAAGLTGLAATILTSGDAPPRVLRPTGAVTLPDGGAGLTISPDSKRRQVQRFLDG
ncbi:MAG: LCP family protein [Solirubrobacteraceae bacterium]|jgi:LCP family protein required for cell wall assembly|nr:LCP family protein [Solirubrobacteraceae bacterium]